MNTEIEGLYRKYGPMVLRRCRFLLREEEKALDAMQDVFVNILSASDNLDYRYPSSLLYRIATNVCLNIIRRDKRLPETTGDMILEQIACIGDHQQSVEANELIDSIFKNEKPSTREIAVMLYIDGLTLEQTAEESGLSVSGVRKRMRLLRERASFFKGEIYEN